MQRTDSRNPFATQTLNGLNNTSPSGYIDVDFTYVYDVTLDADQFLQNQQVAIMTDSDFEWRAWMTGFATGQFAVRFTDSQGYQLSNSLLLNNSFSNGIASSPSPVVPGLIFPAGGRIGIDIQDLSGDTNVIELWFRGVKRFRLSK
jgi:hypothetical protein